MRNFFNMDGGVFRFLSKVADLLILNVLFLICCLPIVTIGTSLTAMSYVTLKMKDGEEGYIARTFFKSFRQNLKQSIVIWLLVLITGVAIGLDFYLIRGMEGSMKMVMQVMVSMGGFIWLMVFLYVFPLQARFYNTIRGTIKNAVLLALANFPRTFCMMAVVIGAFVITFLNQYTLWYGLLFWILLGFAVIAWINSYFIYPVFKKFIPDEEEEEKDGEEELKEI